MSIQKITVAHGERSTLHSELNKTTLEREYVDTQQSTIGRFFAKARLAILGAWGLETVKGADTFYQERDCIKLYQTKLKSFVSYMPSAIHSEKLAGLLDTDVEEYSEGRAEDAVELERQVVEFHSALQGRVQHLGRSRSKEFSREREAQLYQAGMADVRAKIDEHNNSRFKWRDIPVVWNENLINVLADQSLKTIGDNVTAEDIRKQGVKAVADPFALHVLSFGLEDANLDTPLMRKAHNEVIKKKGQACRDRLDQLNSTDHIDQEIAKKVAVRKQPILVNIEDLQNKGDQLSARIADKDNLVHELTSKQEQLQTDLSAKKLKLQNLRIPREKQFIERFVRNKFNDAQLTRLYDAIAKTDEVIDLGEMPNKPAAMIEMCAVDKEQVLEQIQAKITEEVRTQGATQRALLPLLLDLKDLMEQSELLFNPDSEQSPQYIQSVRNKRALQTKISELQEQLDHTESRINIIQQERQALVKELRENLKSKLAQENALQDIDNLVSEEVRAENPLHPVAQQLADTRKASIRENIATLKAKLGYCTDYLNSATRKHGELSKLSTQEEALESELSEKRCLLNNLNKGPKAKLNRRYIKCLHKMPKMSDHTLEFFHALVLKNTNIEILRLQGNIKQVKDLKAKIENWNNQIRTREQSIAKEEAALENVDQETREVFAQQLSNLREIAEAEVVADDSIDANFAPHKEVQPMRVYDPVEDGTLELELEPANNFPKLEDLDNSLERERQATYDSQRLARIRFGNDQLIGASGYNAPNLEALIVENYYQEVQSDQTVRLTDTTMVDLSKEPVVAKAPVPPTKSKSSSGTSKNRPLKLNWLNYVMG